MKTKIDIDGGKYTVVHVNGLYMHALRYGEEWRNDIEHDNLIFAMACEVDELRDENRSLREEVARLKEYEWMYKDLCDD